MKFNSLLREESVLSGLILVVILLFSWPAAAIDSDIPKEYMYMMIAVLFLLLFLAILWDHFRTAFNWILATGAVIVVSIVVVVFFPSAPFFIVLPMVGGTTLVYTVARKRKRHSYKSRTSSTHSESDRPVVTVRPAPTIIRIPAPPPIKVVVPVIKVIRINRSYYVPPSQDQSHDNNK